MNYSKIKAYGHWIEVPLKLGSSKTIGWYSTELKILFCKRRNKHFFRKINSFGMSVERFEGIKDTYEDMEYIIFYNIEEGVSYKVSVEDFDERATLYEQDKADRLNLFEDQKLINIDSEYVKIIPDWQIEEKYKNLGFNKIRNIEELYKAKLKSAYKKSVDRQRGD
jgi:hypothetical protein